MRKKNAVKLVKTKQKKSAIINKGHSIKTFIFMDKRREKKK